MKSQFQFSKFNNPIYLSPYCNIKYCTLHSNKKIQPIPNPNRTGCIFLCSSY